jgi:lysyl-tRNA synthetase class 2
MDELNQILKQRRQKAKELEEMGVNLYSNEFRPSHHIADLLPLDGEINAEPPADADDYRPTYRIAGRITGLRKFGKAAFLHIQDETGRIQIYLKKDIMASAIKLIAKSLRPLPEKFHGLTDVETRYRQRYIDLIVNPEVRTTFKKRIDIIRLMREFLANRGFLEVETPMMQAVPGGATAKPFMTHHNSLNMDLYLRVAPELYLKRLLVGGFEKVFEINRNFRNEGLSTRHNPEFTMLEFYQAYATYHDLMELTEEMIPWIAQEVNSTMEVTYQGRTVDLAPPWKRYTIDEALVEVGGIGQDILDDDAKIVQLAKEKGIELEAKAGPGKAKTELFELLVEEKLVDPTFITAYPTEVSPLARRNEENPQVTDRFELFITGREIANAFSELTDPDDQKSRFEKQIADRGDDEEIHPVLDEDYIRALEYGLPAAAGEGIGVDRLVMLLTDSSSIRDVILFPHLKPEA